MVARFAHRPHPLSSSLTSLAHNARRCAGPSRARAAAPHILTPHTTPTGPFASSVGVGRAEPEWAALNKVKTITGTDQFAEIAKSLFGDKNEAPLPLSKVCDAPSSRAPKQRALLPLTADGPVGVRRR